MFCIALGQRWRADAAAPGPWFAWAAGAALLMLGACATDPGAGTQLPEGVAAVVEMTPLFAHSPEAVVVHVGDTVEWRNRSFFTHTVTADASKAADANHVALPPGAAAFDSGEIERGAAYRYRFTVAGTYHYVCLPHEGMGMTGTVYVLP